MKKLIFILTFLILINSNAMTIGGVKSNHPAVTSILTYSPAIDLSINRYIKSNKVKVILEELLAGKKTTKNFENLKLRTINQTGVFAETLKRHTHFREFWKDFYSHFFMVVQNCSGAFVAKNILRTAWHCIDFKENKNNLKNQNGIWQKITGFTVFLENTSFSRAIEFMRPNTSSDIVYLRFKSEVTNDFLPEANKEEIESYLAQGSKFKYLNLNPPIDSQSYFYGQHLIDDKSKDEGVRLTVHDFFQNKIMLDKSILSNFNKYEQKKGITKFERYYKEAGFNNGHFVQASSNTINQKTQCPLPAGSGGPLIWRGKIIATSSSISKDTLEKFKINYPELLKEGMSPNIKLEANIDSFELLSANGRIFCNFSIYGL